MPGTEYETQKLTEALKIKKRGGRRKKKPGLIDFIRPGHNFHFSARFLLLRDKVHKYIRICFHSFLTNINERRSHKRFIYLTMSVYSSVI